MPLVIIGDTNQFMNISTLVSAQKRPWERARPAHNRMNGKKMRARRVRYQAPQMTRRMSTYQ